MVLPKKQTVDDKRAITIALFLLSAVMQNVAEQCGLIIGKTVGLAKQDFLIC